MGFRLLLLGKSGVGKSAFGNFLLNQRLFKAGLQSSPVTLAYESISAFLSDVRVTVVDTPGLLSNDNSMLNTAIAIQDSFQNGQDMGFRLLLLGKSGVGKSAFGNFLLGGRFFNASLQASPVTLACESISALMCDVRVTIVDTPGLLSNDNSMLNTAIGIQDSFQNGQGEPHVFLIVLQLGRFRVEDVDTIGLIKMIFGPRCLQHGIIIFTHEDQAGNESQSIEELMRDFAGEPYRRALLDECRQRYLTVNCYEKNEEIKATKYRQLMQMTALAVKNDNSVYMPDLQMYRRVLERHLREWTENRLSPDQMERLFMEMIAAEQRQKWIKIVVGGGVLVLGTAALVGVALGTVALTARAVATASNHVAPQLTITNLVLMLEKLDAASLTTFAPSLFNAASRVIRFPIRF